MTSGQWQRLQDLFLAALQREQGERLVFVQEACCGDAALQADLESLLGSYKEGSDFVHLSASGRRAGAADGGSAEELRHPAAIGTYRILRLIGEGGMGLVYEAEQQQPRRTVALKVLKAGLISQDFLWRFRQESQSLARLQHPGIAQIYEAGAEDSGCGLQPFIAMEFIRGQPLVRYADEHQLNTRQRLQLMGKVCEAVHHAHQRGLIHRDLKPGNILVDEAGQPKVLDFGVAHVTDSDVEATQRTDVGQLIGTLAYMSPEQVLADPLALDTRSDVYALGVILYQLLAGRLPYHISPKVHEAVRAIQEDDPAPLSLISRNYRGDVETIVAKALEKDKARRYSSAADVAADIRRYLADEPVAARQPSTSYQLQKLARRHKGVLTGAFGVFVVLVAGILASTQQALRARRAEGTALIEAATAKAVSDFLENDLLAQASPYKQSGLAAHLDPDLKVRTALDRAAARLGGKFDRQPRVEAAIQETIGQTYSDLGQYPQARKHLERALGLYRQVLGDENPKTLRTMRRLGAVAQLEGEYSEAEAILNKTAQVQRRLLGAEHPDTLISMNNLAIIYYFEGNYTKAEKLYSQTLDIQRRVLGPEHPDTLISMNNLGNTYVREGKYHEAEEIGRQTLNIKRHVLGPEHPDTLNSMNGLAVLYLEQSKFAQAQVLQSETLEIKRRVMGPEHPDTLASMNNLANTYYVQGEYAHAGALYSQTVKIKRRVLGPEHPDTLASMNNLADAYYQQGKYVQAEVLFKQVLQISRRVLGAESPYTLSFTSDMAGMYQHRGEYDKAETMATQAVAGERHTLGPENPGTIDAETDLALAYLSRGKFAESQTLAREAVEFDRKKRPDDWQRFRAESLLGASLAGQNRFAEAEPLLLAGYQGMAARKERIAVADRYHFNRAGDWITRLYLDWGKPEKAAEWRKARTAP